MRELLTLAELRALDVRGALATRSDDDCEAAVHDISSYLASLVGHDFPTQPATEKLCLGSGGAILDLRGAKGTDMPLAAMPTNVAFSFEGSVDYSIDLDQLYLLPLNGGPAYYGLRRLDGGVWNWNVKTVITADWGWPVIDDQLKRQIYIMVCRAFADSAFAEWARTGQVVRGVSATSVGDTVASVQFDSVGDSRSALSTSRELQSALRRYLWRGRVLIP